MKRTEKDFLRAVKKVNRRYFTEVAERRAAPARFAAKQEERKHPMKKHSDTEKRTRVRKPFLAAGLAAAALLLTAGGITAAVAMRRAGITVQTSEPDVTEVLHLNLTDEYSDPAELNLSLSIYDDTWAAETESGWYYKFKKTDVCEEKDPSGEHISFNSSSGNAMLYFTSKETGESVPLCARANCLHDGNAFCEASTNAYNYIKIMTYHDQLFALGTKDSGPVVLRFAPDGTGITEYATFSFPYSYPLSASFCIHRGYLFGIVLLTDETESAQDVIAGKTSVRRSGYAVVYCELATGKSGVLYEDMPEEGKAEEHPSPDGIWCVGDDLFYYWHYQTSDLSGRANHGIYKISLLTGEQELYIEGGITDVAASENAILYKRYDIATGGRISHLRDLQTGEDTLVPGDFLSDQYVFSLAYPQMQITDYAGNEICTLPSFLENQMWWAQYIKDGKLYCIAEPSDCETLEELVASPKKLLSVPIETLLSGNASDDDWETVLVMEERAAVDYDPTRS